MNSQTKEQELIQMLENIEKSYTPDSPHYRFKHVFYNVVNTPFTRPSSFPADLWNKFITPNPSLMPVILNKDQINQRKAQQNDLGMKLNESLQSVLKKIDSLKAKREMIRNKYEVICQKFRIARRQYVGGEVNENVFKLYVDTVDRERFMVKNSKPELLRYLVGMNSRLKDLEKRVSESLFSVEKRRILFDTDKIKQSSFK